MNELTKREKVMNDIEEFKKYREESFIQIGKKTMQAYYYITEIFKICKYQEKIVNKLFELERELAHEEDTNNN